MAKKSIVPCRSLLASFCRTTSGLQFVDNDDEHNDARMRMLSLLFQLLQDSPEDNRVQSSSGDRVGDGQVAARTPNSELGMHLSGDSPCAGAYSPAMPTKKSKKASVGGSGKHGKLTRDRGGQVQFMRQYLVAALPCLKQLPNG
jgi:hypothetical protein